MDTQQSEKIGFPQNNSTSCIVLGEMNPVDLSLPNMSIHDTPNVSMHLNSEMITYHIMTLPKIVAINPVPYSSTTHQLKIEDANYNGHVHNMIRWRYTSEESSLNGDDTRDIKSEKLRKESNTKIIQWNDGTWGLMVGNEMFDIDEFQCFTDEKQCTSKKHTGAPPCNMKRDKDSINKILGINTKEFIYISKKSDKILPNFSNIDNGKHSTTITETVLECFAPLFSKFIPRPASLKSTAHKNFVLAERSRNLKRARIAEHMTFVDPEKEKLERIRSKDDIIKQERRSSAKRSIINVCRGRRDRSMFSRKNVDEDGEAFDSVNISTIKRSMYHYNEIDEFAHNVLKNRIDEDKDKWMNNRKRGFEEERKKKQVKNRRNMECFSQNKECIKKKFDMVSINGISFVGEDSDEEDEVIIRKMAKSMKERSKKIIDDDD